ncbi:MAG TPA: chromosomal replication initiator protein DnaA [Patescibacteria group bacterium]|nr:chromosomal replication initiator protein DnaA [Patescibacteria group bacterium]
MTKDELWQAVLGELELSLSKANFITWFKNTFIIAEENEQVIIGVPNLFTQAWFEKKYHDLIIKTLKKITNNRVKNIIYKIEVHKPDGLMLAEKIEVTFNQPTREVEFLASTNESHGLNPKYTFEKFIVGKNNELAHAAAKAISEKPGEIYNPLFLYGGVGLGKTHLLQAVGHVLLLKNPKIKVLYTTCEKFTNDFVQAIRTGKTKAFQDKYRDVDLLIIDDIQFMEGKEQTQEQFFHTFNDLYQKNKQIVISSDRPPKAIPTLEDRLRSRFECGMIADIGEPDLETRTAILGAKLAEKNYFLSEEIINHIASTIQSNIRELEGALNRIIAHHELKKETPTLESVKAIVSGLVNLPRKGSIAPKLIIQTVSEYFSISINDIIGSCRKKELVVPRQIIMYFMREELDASFPNIGNELGGRDHTTAMHAHTKIKNKLIDDDKLRQDITILKQKIFNSAV